MSLKSCFVFFKVFINFIANKKIWKEDLIKLVLLRIEVLNYCANLSILFLNEKRPVWLQQTSNQN